jgi:predicted transcriptional regulator
MTTDTVSINQQIEQIKFDKEYEQYLDNAIKRGEKAIKNGEVIPHNEVVSYMKEKFFSKND